VSLLFVQYWDVIRGKEDEYAQYVNDTYLPEIATLGFIPAGGYYVEVGFGPRTIIVFSSESLDEISKTITGNSYKNLVLALKKYVANFKNSVLEPTGLIKRGKYPIQKGVWKYNQYYDLRPEMKDAYERFFINEYLPTIQNIDYVEATGNWNVVLGGFCEIIAEFTFKEPEDIGRIMKNEELQKVTRRLKKEFVTNYANRIQRSMRWFTEPKWFKL
jgi:hypothetical protein